MRLIPTIIVKGLLRLMYGVFCLVSKVDEKKITFASYRSDTIKDNLEYVKDEITLKYPSFKQQFLFKKFDSSSVGKISYIFHMISACWHLATSRYFLIDDYYLPIYLINPRKNTEIIQLWHSAGALKKFGLSTVGKPFGPSKEYLKHVNIHGNYTKAYVSSREVIPYFAEAFNMEEERIYPLGVPRTDYFFAENISLRQQFYSDYPNLADKKLLLYAPTFRGKSHYQGTFELPFDLDYMNKELSDEYGLMVHLHPYMREEIHLNGNGFAYQVQDTYTIQELLELTDILITDYSTIFFDFSLKERPMIFYPHDLEEYKRERDFYYEYENLVPGSIVKDTQSLVKLIKNNNGDVDDITNFKNRFFDYQDGKATERIVEHIFNR